MSNAVEIVEDRPPRLRRIAAAVSNAVNVEWRLPWFPMPYFRWRIYHCVITGRFLDWPDHPESVIEVVERGPIVIAGADELPA
jgi:hypothetical protein